MLASHSTTTTTTNGSQQCWLAILPSPYQLLKWHTYLHVASMLHEQYCWTCVNYHSLWCSCTTNFCGIILLRWLYPLVFLLFMQDHSRPLCSWTYSTRAIWKCRLHMKLLAIICYVTFKPPSFFLICIYIYTCMCIWSCICISYLKHTSK